MDKNVSHVEMTEEEFLKNYDIKKYDRPSMTVDIMLLTVADTLNDNYRKLPDKQLKVLLIKRNEHPFKNMWALPGGFVQMDEDLETGAFRELKEETGVDHVYLEQLYTHSDVDRDPRGRIISTAYLSLVDEELMNIKAGSDAADAKWFNLEVNLINQERINANDGFDESTYYDVLLNNELDSLKASVCVNRKVRGRQVSIKRKIVSSEGLAFDHGMILQEGLERLRNKIEYTDIAFHLLPDLFTLTELQKTYEKILDKPLLKANFRRKISKYVVETDKMTSDAGHRPSKLFKFKLG